jgi:predicted acyltransferase
MQTTNQQQTLLLGLIIFFKGHLWSATKVWDPEGILSTLPAIGTAMLGIFTGNWLRSEKDQTTKTVWLIYLGRRFNGCWLDLEWLVSNQ